MLNIFGNKLSEKLNSAGEMVTIIQPKSDWKIVNIKELVEYRDLFYFLVWRDIKVLYAQTILGFSWAIINPLIQIVLFSIIFGKVAQLSTEGIPYILFSSVAIIPWTYMSSSMTQSSQSLISGAGMLGKVYFPRLIFPLTPIFSRLIDFGISMALMICIMVYFQVKPTWNFVFLPLFLILMMAIPCGIGLWLSSLAIRFRDVKQAMTFFIQMLMYSAPIVYSASSIPDKYRILYALNPIVGVIEGFRACFLGTTIPWLFIVPGMFTAMLLVVSGALYFKRMERIVVDVI